MAPGFNNIVRNAAKPRRPLLYLATLRRASCPIILLLKDDRHKDPTMRQYQIDRICFRILVAICLCVVRLSCSPETRSNPYLTISEPKSGSRTLIFHRQAKASAAKLSTLFSWWVGGGSPQMREWGEGSPVMGVSSRMSSTFENQKVFPPRFATLGFPSHDVS